jgi:hypothetical protein
LSPQSQRPAAGARNKAKISKEPDCRLQVGIKEIFLGKFGLISRLIYTELYFNPSFQLVEILYWLPDKGRATPSNRDRLTNPFAPTMHPPIVGKYIFYLYRFIELIRRFKMVPLLFKYTYIK